MTSILSAILTGVVTFAATNIDDLFILIFIFSQVGAALRPGHVVAGQYLGFAALVAVSLLGFFGSFIVPTAWIGLLGFLPLAMGVNKLIHGREESKPPQIDRLGKPPRRGILFSSIFSRQTLAVAGVTFANGGDNLGIYTPLFAGSSPIRLGILLIVYFLCAGVWCYAGRLLSRHPLVARDFSRRGRLLIPFALIGLGIYLLLDSGGAALLIGWLQIFSIAS